MRLGYVVTIICLDQNRYVYYNEPDRGCWIGDWSHSIHIFNSSMFENKKDAVEIKDDFIKSGYEAEVKELYLK